MKPNQSTGSATQGPNWSLDLCLSFHDGAARSGRRASHHTSYIKGRDSGVAVSIKTFGHHPSGSELAAHLRQAIHKTKRTPLTILCDHGVTSATFDADCAKRGVAVLHPRATAPVHDAI